MNKLSIFATICTLAATHAARLHPRHLLTIDNEGKTTSTVLGNVSAGPSIWRKLSPSWKDFRSEGDERNLARLHRNLSPSGNGKYFKSTYAFSRGAGGGSVFYTAPSSLQYYGRNLHSIHHDIKQGIKQEQKADKYESKAFFAPSYKKSLKQEYKSDKHDAKSTYAFSRGAGGGSVFYTAPSSLQYYTYGRNLPITTG